MHVEYRVHTKKETRGGGDFSLSPARQKVRPCLEIRKNVRITCNYNVFRIYSYIYIYIYLYKYTYVYMKLCLVLLFIEKHNKQKKRKEVGSYI